MTAPATVMLTPAELNRLEMEINKLLDKAKQWVGGVIEQWKEAVRIWVQRVRDILGDRPKLQNAIEAWKGAATLISNIEFELKNVTDRNNLWEGAGANGFENWVGGHLTALERWKNTFGSTGAATGAFVRSLGMASKAVVDFLVGLGAALTRLLMGLNDAVGNLGGGISVTIPVGPSIPSVTVNPGAVTMAVASALNGFVEAANTVLEKAAALLTAADDAGNDFEAAANSLTRFTAPKGYWDTQGGHPGKNDR